MIYRESQPIQKEYKSKKKIREVPKTSQFYKNIQKSITILVLNLCVPF